MKGSTMSLLQFKKSVFLLACCLFIIVGCTKKVTKIETPPPEPTPTVVKEEPIPVKDDSFVVEKTEENVFLPIYFDYDQYDLRPQAIEQLGKIALHLSNNADVRILVEGHADERGTDEYNIGLAEKRAKAAKNYLVNYGLSNGRFEVVSYGKARPADPNCGEDDFCHGKNRRVEWKVLTK